MPVAQSFLDRWGGFVTVTAALSLCFSTGSLPTPLYPLYQAAWQIPPSDLSYIFTAYMVAVLFALVCFGRLSDAVGRFRVIVTSLSLLMLGMLLSALSTGVVMLVVARFIIGFGNGLLTTAGAIALAESHPRRDKNVASVTTSIAISIAFGVGPVVGGSIAQVGVAPLVLPYVLVLLLAMVNLALAVRSRAQLQGPFGLRSPISVRPQMALPARDKRPIFLLACFAGFSTFAVGCLFASLVPSALGAMLPWSGPIVIGVAFLILTLASIAVQLTQRGIAPFKGLAFGMLGFTLCLGTLTLGLVTHNIWVLALSMVFTGIGQGYSFMCSTVIAGQYVDEHRRSANMSTFFFSAYIGATAPIIAVGLLADKIGLSSAIFTFSGLIACLLLILAALSSRYAYIKGDTWSPLA